MRYEIRFYYNQKGNQCSWEAFIANENELVRRTGDFSYSGLGETMPNQKTLENKVVDSLIEDGDLLEKDKQLT